MSTPPTLDALIPEALLGHILSFLTAQQMGRAFQTSRAMLAAAEGAAMANAVAHRLALSPPAPGEGWAAALQAASSAASTPASMMLEG